MSFIINQNFDLKSPQFNFARDYFDNLANLKAADENDFPNHFITNVAGDLYQLNKGYISIDTTGRWRKIKLGSDVDLSGYATTAELNKKAEKSEAVKTLSAAADRSKISIAGTHVDNTITVADIPLAVYSVTSDEENTQKAGLVTGAERKRLLSLGLSGNSFNDAVNNTKGLRLNLNGTNSSVDISIAKPGDDSTYGLMSGADKAKLDDVANTYATKSEVSALSSALVYRGTVDTKYALPTKNVKVGDVYVVAAAGTFAGQTCEAGDMIIAQTASNAEGTPAPTWTVVQTNINGAVTTSSTLGDGKLIIGGGGTSVRTASATGFVKIINGDVSIDKSTYLKSVPKATINALGGGKVVNVYNGTAALANADPDSSDFILEGLQIDSDGNFYTPVMRYATATTSDDGLMSSSDKKKLDILQNYILPVATANNLGGIEIGFAKNDAAKNYPVELSGNKAYVHVPWTDTNTTYPLASASTNGLMSATDKKKLDTIQNPTAITTAQLDLCGYADVTSLVNAVANQKDGLSFFVTDQNAIVTLQTDNGKHAIIQTIRTATELNNSWEFATGATSSHTDGVLFTYQRFYPIGGTYSTSTRNKWTKWAIIDIDTMYTDGRINMNAVYKAKGKQLHSNLSVDTNGKITFSSTYSGTNTEGIKSESKDILTPISASEITGLFN